MTRAEKMRALVAIAEEEAVSEDLIWEIHDAATREEDIDGRSWNGNS